MRGFSDSLRRHKALMSVSMPQPSLEEKDFISRARRQDSKSGDEAHFGVSRRKEARIVARRLFRRRCWSAVGDVLIEDKTVDI